VFSGLIAHEGVVDAVGGDAKRGITLVIAAPSALTEGVLRGDSVAVNGVCLTVVALDERTMHFDVVPETIARAAFETLSRGDRVNVELSLRLGDRLGGHLVYGHVDANAPIVALEAEGQGFRLGVALPPDLRPFVVEKGYVAVDGVSLTIAATTDAAFEIALIPETARRTTLGRKGVGDRVTIEVDPVARYVQGALAAYASRDA
jgi:riboflavin synthase